ncbi:non-heme iron oxygenase ferredoxin subunit [Acidobacteria bacterium AH-259-D05]|nr:non-heme iron oxygenase ferredoxin subunit [Acidobacteria bacterium AH-259-D05]
MGELTKVATTQELQPGDSICVEVGGKQIALFNVEGAYYAVDDTCTHHGGPLSDGDFEGTTVTCPWHGAQFDLKTGGVLGPPAQQGVDVYQVVVEGEDIKIEA